MQADFCFEYASQEDIIDKSMQIKFRREKNQPLREKTSGSTFKNPAGDFAASLIEKAGCKGMNIGGASVSTIHSNFILIMEMQQPWILKI